MYTVEYFSVLRNEILTRAGVPYACTMDEPRSLYAKWNKPDTVGHIFI